MNSINSIKVLAHNVNKIQNMKTLAEKAVCNNDLYLSQLYILDTHCVPDVVGLGMVIDDKNNGTCNNIAIDKSKNADPL